MRTSAAVGALASIVLGIAGLAFMVLQLGAQSLGYEDTDNPSVSLAYLHDHLDTYVLQGIALFVLAIALTIVVFAVWDVLAGRANSLGLRTMSTFGLVAAACFFLFGVMRYSVRPLLYIDGLKPAWGESAYLVSQMAGIHGFVQAAIVAVCGWVVGVSILGYKARALPRWLALLAIIPVIRLLAVLGPLDLLPGGLWIVFMLSIPGTFVWFVLLGFVLLSQARRSRGHPVAA